MSIDGANTVRLCYIQDNPLEDIKDYDTQHYKTNQTNVKTQHSP
jgi:hypothetical protein